LAGWVGKRLSLGQVVLGVNWLWAILWPLFALAPNAAVLGAVYALAVFGGPMWNVVLGSYFRAIVPDELQARVDSVETMISWGTIPLGSALSGLLLETVGAFSAVFVLAGCMLAIAVAGQLSSHIRRAPPISQAGLA
jgi:hypothetical protein